MLRRFVSLGLVGVFLAISLVVAQDSVGPYNPIADVNRDGTVDILDLVEVGKAFGSNNVLDEANRTTVVVLTYDKEPIYIEGARIAIFSRPFSNYAIPMAVECTNSSGITTFQTSPDANYTAVALKGSAYNYANFTTNSMGEASVVVPWGLSSTLPENWVVLSFLDNITDLPVNIWTRIWFEEMWYNNSDPHGNGYWEWESVDDFIVWPAQITGTNLGMFKPKTLYSVRCNCPLPWENYTFSSSAFQTDGYGCASVVVYCYHKP